MLSELRSEIYDFFKVLGKRAWMFESTGLTSRLEGLAVDEKRRSGRYLMADR